MPWVWAYFGTLCDLWSDLQSMIYFASGEVTEVYFLQEKPSLLNSTFWRMPLNVQSEYFVDQSLFVAHSVCWLIDWLICSFNTLMTGRVVPICMYISHRSRPHYKLLLRMAFSSWLLNHSCMPELSMCNWSFWVQFLLKQKLLLLGKRVKFFVLTRKNCLLFHQWGPSHMAT